MILGKNVINDWSKGIEIASWKFLSHHKHLLRSKKKVYCITYKTEIIKKHVTLSDQKMLLGKTKSTLFSTNHYL